MSTFKDHARGKIRNTHVDLESIRRVPSKISRRPGGFAVCTSTNVLLGIVGLVIACTAGVLTAVLLTSNILTSKDSATSSSLSIATTTTSVTVTTTTTTTTTTASTTTTTETTSTVTTSTTTTASRRVFALSQTISGQTVTCSSVVNSNLSFTECDDIQKGGLYAPNGITCTNAWSTTQSSYWSTIAFCQTFLNTNNTYIQAFYDCNTSQVRFTWSSGGVWGTINDNGYTKNLRCYY